MKQLKKKIFLTLKKDELENVLGGLTTIAYYKDENGHIKMKIVQIDRNPLTMSR
ncbi:MAG: hypothetical protein ABFD09_12875 [Proteiniphilum sp.]